MPSSLQTAFALLGVIAMFGLTFLFSRSYGAVAPPKIDPKFEARLVEAVIVAEARGEGLAGWRGVAEVIRNRMAARQRTAYEIVTAPKQFSCLNGWTDLEKFIRSAMNEEALSNMTTYEIARGVCEGRLKGNITGGANHYHAVEVTPKWADPKKRTAKLGKHIFYKL